MLTSPLRLRLVDKLADYEDELRQLKSTAQSTDSHTPAVEAPSRPTSAAAVTRHQLQTRLSSLLPSGRRSSSQPPSSAPPTQQVHPENADSADLLNLLTKEQQLRQAAERRVSQTNEEIEELSAQLFSEANEMVATERKARVKLEERVAVLEKRDGEKRVRLEVLEGRLARIERVRGLLNGEKKL